MTDMTWLPLPDVAERCLVTVIDVREWLREGRVVAVRRGENNVWCVAEEFLADGGPLAMLRGTITVLRDARLTDEEIVEWLAADHELLGMSPIAALRDGRRARVRAAAQALG